MERTMATEHTQFELFPFLTGRPHSRVTRPRYLLKDLTLSVENTIVLCIIFVMAVVLFFSFGVERGKQIVKGALAEPPVTVTVLPAPEDSSDKIRERSLAPAGNTKAQKSAASLQPAGAQQQEKQHKQIPASAPSLEKKEKGTFTIQVASFKEKEKAQMEAKRLRSKGYEIFVLPKGKHSIVCVGKFAIKDEATEFSNKLKNKYNDCLVRRL
ncbi:MAG: hypothetical protein A2705_02485 [Omnitrophica WOR_2 bacterium RIFCSPHIGHO2_01_FULL_52_10]|nr:MAG: hypothetical protein A2705_02485 [Omnitrophica WOR_2 bacterium RIFCSPHIGHO2_01_FULL_52_10]